MTGFDSNNVRRIVQLALDARPHVVLAVSGGLDSMALLHAAAAVMPAARLTVATYDHATGDAATTAANLVESTAAGLSVACVRERAATELRSEAALRDARWSFLRRIASERDASIATAHTESDQVETVVMRTLRRTGARGLAALFAESDVVRPFVGLRRAELEDYARASGLVWVDDPSNTSRRFLRNRVRHELLPALRGARPTLDAELLDLARRAADWRRDVDTFVARSVPVRAHGADRGVDVDASAIIALGAAAGAIVWPAILTRIGVVLDRRGFDRVTRFTERSRVGARIQLSGRWQIVRSRGDFEVRPSPLAFERDGATLEPVALSNGTCFGDWSFERRVADSDERLGEHDGPWSAMLPADRALSIRRWQPGDAMQPEGRRARRKVKQLLSDAGVTGHQRAAWPVVLADDEIVWVPGVRRSHAATARSGQPGLPFRCDYYYRSIFG